MLGAVALHQAVHELSVVGIGVVPLKPFTGLRRGGPGRRDIIVPAESGKRVSRIAEELVDLFFVECRFLWAHNVWYWSYSVIELVLIDYTKRFLVDL